MSEARRVLLVGVPCAGRHVVISILLAMGASKRHDLGAPLPRGGTPAEPASQVAAVRAALAALPPGGICHGALPFDPDLLEVAQEAGAAVIFVMRDPADIVPAVSRQIRVYGRPPELATAFGARTPDDLLRALLLGAAPAVPLDRLLSWFEGWSTAPGVLTVRFEDLIGPDGGGDAAPRRDAVEAIARHVGRPDDELVVERGASASFNPLARTFVQGQAGSTLHEIPGWYDRFISEHYPRLREAWGYRGQLGRRQERAGDGTSRDEAERWSAILRRATHELADRRDGQLQGLQARLAARQQTIDDLHALLDRVQSENGDRLAALAAAQRQLAEVHAENAARLDTIRTLQRRLETVEAESAARLAELRALAARTEPLKPAPTSPVASDPAPPMPSSLGTSPVRIPPVPRAAPPDLVLPLGDDTVRSIAQLIVALRTKTRLPHPSLVARGWELLYVEIEKGTGFGNEVVREEDEDAAADTRHGKASPSVWLEYLLYLLAGRLTVVEEDSTNRLAAIRQVQERLRQVNQDNDARLATIRLLEQRLQSLETESATRRAVARGLEERLRHVEAESEMRLARTRQLDERLQQIQDESETRLFSSHQLQDRLDAARKLEARLRSVEAESEVRLSRVRYLEAQLATAWAAADARLTIIREIQGKPGPTSPPHPSDAHDLPEPSIQIPDRTAPASTEGGP